MTQLTDKELNIYQGDASRMGAYPVGKGVTFTTAIEHVETLFLIVTDEKYNEMCRVDMDEYCSIGTISSVHIDGIAASDIRYIYLSDNSYVCDPYCMKKAQLRAWGEKKDVYSDYCAVYIDDFDWQDDRKCAISSCDVIGYSLHVRGFSAHISSKVRHRGTYLGITEKIDYLKELGINRIELMPAYDFYEWDADEKYPIYSPLIRRTENAEDGVKMNFWGFKSADYCCPKGGYACKDPINEFKTMVRQLHSSGIEVTMRMFFPRDIKRSMIRDILLIWSKEYHVDGFFLMGDNLPKALLAGDPYLSDCVLCFENCAELGDLHDTLIRGRKYSDLYCADGGYAEDIRRYLKSDEDMLGKFTSRMRSNPEGIRNINYITTFRGFTLNDLVSYDYKHNEENGEDNRDGDSYNYSWNCGAEGESKKSGVTALRLKQMKNAMTFLLLAQGVPMILAGDEFMNSQNGNNNPYCQDNEISYLIWKNNKAAAELTEFVRKLIKLRRSHPILHYPAEFRVMDYKAYGYPDVSYHGDAPWYPRFDNHLRHVGIMLCGKYALLTDGKEDDFFYIASNTHWERHLFGLPKLPKGMKWTIEFTTAGGKSVCEILTDETTFAQELLTDERSVVVLRSASL